MAIWLGHGDPVKWDAMPYPDQCDCLEVFRAEQAIKQYDAAQQRAQADRANRARSAARTRGRR